MYAAIVGAATRYFLYSPNRALIEETGVIALFALIAAVLGGLTARRANYAVDGVFAFLMAWLFFGALAFCLALFWVIEPVFRGTAMTSEQIGVSLANLVIVPFVALFFSIAPALVSCLVYQMARFAFSRLESSSRSPD